MYSGNRWQLLAEYNAWINGRLYETCGTLSDEERRRDRGAYFKSIHSTLNHILWGDRAWMSRFTAKTYSPPVPIGTDLFADFDELRNAREAIDRGMAAGAIHLRQSGLPGHAYPAGLGVRHAYVQSSDASPRPADHPIVANGYRPRHHGHTDDAAAGVIARPTGLQCMICVDIPARSAHGPVCTDGPFSA